MLGFGRGRRKGSEIIGFADLAPAALSCSLLFRGTSGNPADALDASEMTLSNSRLNHASPRRRSRWLAVALLVAAALPLGGCGDMFTQVYQRGYIPPEGALEQVPLGATQDQVLIVLGTPSTVATISGETFYYISQRAEQKLAFLTQDVTNQRVIAVYFDKNRRVARLANYGLKDGRVFDFVSRTTPTSGTELNYIYYVFALTKPLNIGY
jgi:outer membrane protein assembly factor BamE (lipoprotein component of BamABCDE complex)